MNYEKLNEQIENSGKLMTEEERMEKYWAGEKVDHIPFNLLSMEYALTDLYNYRTIDVFNDSDLWVEKMKKGLDDGYISSVNVGLNLQTLGGAVGSKMHYPEHGIERIEEHILQSWDDWDKMADPDPYDNPVLTPMLEKARKIKKEIPGIQVTTSVCGPISTAVAIRPVESLLKDTRKKPDMVKKLLEFCVDQSLRWVLAFVDEFGPVQTSISDPVSTTDILNSKQFEEFSLPGLKNLAAGLKEITGLAPSMHICGHSAGLWPYMEEIGISSFSVDNIENLEELKNVLGDKMPIVGNVPPVEVMSQGSPEDVVESVKECIRKGADSPEGYILSTGCQTPIGTSRENIEAYFWAARTYGAGAQKGKLPEGLSRE